MIRPLCFPSVLLLTTLLSAQAEPDQTVVQDPRGIAAAWRAFVAEHGSWQVEWSLSAGTPRAIFGPGLPLGAPVHSAAAAQETGTQLLRRFARLLGQGSSSWRLQSSAKVHQTHVLVYEQRFGGLRVLDGRADLRLHERGVLSMLGSECFAVPADAGLQPRLDAAAARRVVQREYELPVTALLGRAVPELLFWTRRESREPSLPRLAWQVTVHSAQKVGRAFVDAGSGALLEFRSDRRSCGCSLHRRLRPGASRGAARAARRAPAAPAAAVVGTVMGYLSTHPGPGGALQNLPMGGIKVQVQGGNSALTDAQGRFSIPHAGTQPVTVTLGFGNGRHVGSFATGSGTLYAGKVTMTPGSPRTIQIYGPTASAEERAQSTTCYLVDRVAEYVRQAHILGNNPALQALQNMSVVVNSSQASCNAQYAQNRIQFGAAQGAQCPNMAFSTVVEHEWGHGLDDVFGGISGQGGLAEGWADVVANYFTGQPIIGKDFQGAGQHVRDAGNQRQFGTGSGTHQQGESWMGGCWKWRQALVAKLGQSAGVRHAETVVLGSLVANAATQPAALRELFLLDDNDGNLNNGTPNCRELFFAFVQTHGIPAPLRSCSANPGDFSVYGQGCQGTGRSAGFCLSLNSAGGSFVPPPPPGTEIAMVLQPKTAQQITAVEIYTQAQQANTKLSLRLHRSSGQLPAANAVAVAQGTVGTSAGWYRFSLPAPLSVAANERLFLVQKPDQMAPALLNAGQQPSDKSLTRHPLFAPTWGPLPFGVNDAPAWRLVCVGSGGNNAVPQLSSPDLPEISHPFRLQLQAARPSSTALLVIGASDQQYGALSLPLDLQVIGAKGCLLLASIDVLLPGSVDAQGKSTWTSNLPNNKALLGSRIYLQTAVTDPQVNALGLALSNGAAVKIGER